MQSFTDLAPSILLLHPPHGSQIPSISWLRGEEDGIRHGPGLEMVLITSASISLARIKSHDLI